MIPHFQKIINRKSENFKSSMSKLRKNILIIFLSLNLFLLLSGISYGLCIGSFESAGKEAFPCYFREHFGLYCPGCGGSRSLYFLITLDLWRSFVYFPALPIAAILIFILDVFALLSFIYNDERILKKLNLNLFIIIPAVIILNFLLRNALLLFGIDYIGNFS